MIVPPYSPHLNPIERLWAVMHKNVTHNKYYAICGQFADTKLEPEPLPRLRQR
jgi:transposase